MKRIISILLILTIAAPFWISYSILQYQKYHVKKEIKSSIIKNIDKTDLVMLKFSQEEAERKLEWEHSREFEFSGVMYDVVYKRIKSDSVFYWCWKDVKETELNYKLTQLVEEAADTNNAKSENLKLLSNLLAGLFISGENPFDLHRNEIKSVQQSNYITHFNSFPTDPLVPPPQAS